jgi:hypothetical protein
LADAVVELGAGMCLPTCVRARSVELGGPRSQGQDSRAHHRRRYVFFTKDPENLMCRRWRRSAVERRIIKNS